jgi:vancomycin resistance protein YoaR
MSLLQRRVLPVVVGSLLGVSGAYGLDRVVPTSPYVRGLEVAGQGVPAPEDVTAWLEARATEAASGTLTLRYGAFERSASYAELGLAVDVEGTRDAALRVGHEGTVFRRYRESEAAKKGDVDVPFVWRLDRDKTHAFLSALAPELARPPVDARIDLAERRKIPEEPGLALDVEASVERIAEAERGVDARVELVVRESSPRVTVADLVAVDVEKVVASFETTFSLVGTGRGRSVNVRNAANRIDGLVLAPGQMFSFNDVVGPRTLENGFTFAPEIQGDELQTGVGGGTCQVSSTLHAAALYAALGVVERQGHSLVSSYTKLGLDATVSYPTTDLKLQNTLPFPVMIHAFFPKETTIRVEILGGDPVARVDYSYGVGAAYDFVRRVTVRPELPAGKRIKRQKGSRGFDVTSVVRLEFLDGRVDERRYYTGYRPKPEVFWVSADYDEAELPPLPEHARGVEGRPSENELAAIYPM